MPHQHRLERMISFRVTDEEYQKLKELSEKANARSMSDIARTAMQHWLRHGSTVAPDNLQVKVLELERRIAELSAQLDRLAALEQH